MTPEGRKIAYDNMKAAGIDALIVIGGYDTALNTIVQCVDKIRDTATSHDRIFFIEVMGRDAGFLAQNSAIASGAEAAIIPEDKTDVDQLEQFISRGFRKSKNSSIVLVSESKKVGGAMHYAERIRTEYPQYDVRVTILGHLQRGGTPSAFDRILACASECGQKSAYSTSRCCHRHLWRRGCQNDSGRLCLREIGLPSEVIKRLLEVLFVSSEYVIQDTERNDFGLTVVRDGPHAADKVIFYFQRIVEYNSSEAGSQH